MGDDTRFPEDDVLRISCDDCAMQHSEACADCVVSFVCDHDPEDALVIDADEARALRSLAQVGLVPTLRLIQRPAS